MWLLDGGRFRSPLRRFASASRVGFAIRARDHRSRGRTPAARPVSPCRTLLSGRLFEGFERLSGIGETGLRLAGARRLATMGACIWFPVALSFGTPPSGAQRGSKEGGSAERWPGASAAKIQTRSYRRVRDSTRLHSLVRPASARVESWCGLICLMSPNYSVRDGIDFRLRLRPLTVGRGVSSVTSLRLKLMILPTLNGCSFPLATNR